MKKEYLTKEQELACGEKIQAMQVAKKRLLRRGLSEKTIAALNQDIVDGTEAVETLIMANSDLVHSRAQKIRKILPNLPPHEDLVQMGMVGITKAAYKYDPTMKFKFSTMATWWIDQAIRREVNETHRLVRLPENRIENYRKVLQEASKHEHEDLPQNELDKIISADTGFSKTVISNMRNAMNPATSLNRKIGDGEGARELGDIIGETATISSPSSIYDTKESYSILQNAVRSLDDVKASIVIAHYRMGQSKPVEVREEHGLSVSRYRRLLSEALCELKDALTSSQLELPDFLE